MINKVIHWDCLEEMKNIPDWSIDMILCDLPYWTTQNKWDSIIPLDLLWKQYERIIKNNWAIVLTAQTPFDKVLGVSNLKLLKYEWIWEKSQATGFLNSKKMPLKNHENILVYYKKPPVYNPQFTEWKPYTAKSNSSANKWNYWKFNDNITINEWIRYPKSIQKFTNWWKCDHPTQKPVALFEYLIKTYTNEWDLVLDNCAWSWTTWVACQNTNRNYILIEKEQEYIDIINKRLWSNIK